MASSPGLSDIIKGDTKQYKMGFRGKLGESIDLTNGQIWFTMKKRPDDSDDLAVLQVTVSPGSSSISSVRDDALVGVAYLTLSSVDTNIPVGEYHYDIQIVFPGNPPIVTTLTIGLINVLQDITNRFA